jgi:CheY-like chemotaxis protein
MHTAILGPDRSESAQDVQAARAHSTWLETKAAHNAGRIALLLTLRSVDLKDSRLEPLPSPMGFDPSKSLIVVVDDEPVIAITLSEILIRHGFEAIWFTVATEALDFIRVCHFDLLLSDVTMPTMDGISLAAELLNLRSDCAVFLFSGRSHEPEVRQRVSILSASIHLEAKPLRVEPLIATIGLLLARSSCNRQRLSSEA